MSSDWKRLSTSLNTDDLVQNEYNPPAIVLSTAITPVNDSAPLQFQWYPEYVNEQYYLYLHFHEVEKQALALNETREFNIIVNGKFWYGPVALEYRYPFTIFSKIPLPRAKTYLISLSKTENSTLPPILNAIEVYQVQDFSQSETQEDDGKLSLC